MRQFLIDKVKEFNYKDEIKFICDNYNKFDYFDICTDSLKRKSVIKMRIECPKECDKLPINQKILVEDHVMVKKKETVDYSGVMNNGKYYYYLIFYIIF